MVSLTDENLVLPVQTLTFNASDYFDVRAEDYYVPYQLEQQVDAYGFRLALGKGLSRDGEIVHTLYVYVRTAEENTYDEFYLNEGEKIAFLGYRRAMKV